MHDKELLKQIALLGIPNITKNENFKEMQVTKEMLLNRVESICEYFRDNLTAFKAYVKKNP